MMNQCFSLFKKLISTECIFLYIITMIANPTVTSAAATTMMKKTKSCASVPTVVAASVAKAATWCIFEKATNSTFTAFNMSSIHMKMMIALRLVNTPTIPIVKSAIERKM